MSKAKRPLEKPIREPADKIVDRENTIFAPNPFFTDDAEEDTYYVDDDTAEPYNWKDA